MTAQLEGVYRKPPCVLNIRDRVYDAEDLRDRTKP